MTIPVQPGSLSSIRAGHVSASYISDTTGYAGDWCLIEAKTATVFAILTSETFRINAGDRGVTGNLNGLSLAAGQKIKGRFSLIKLTSGSVVAHSTRGTDDRIVTSSEEVAAMSKAYFKSDAPYVFSAGAVESRIDPYGVPTRWMETPSGFDDTQLRYAGGDFTWFWWFNVFGPDNGGDFVGRGNNNFSTDQFSLYCNAPSPSWVQLTAFDTSSNLYQLYSGLVAPITGWHLAVMRYKASTKLLELLTDGQKRTVAVGAFAQTLVAALRDGPARTSFGSSVFAFPGVSGLTGGKMRSCGFCKGSQLSDTEVATLYNNRSILPLEDLPFKAKVTNYWGLDGYDYTTPAARYQDSVGTADLSVQNDQTTPNSVPDNTVSRHTTKGGGLFRWSALGIGNYFEARSDNPNPKRPVVVTKFGLDVRGDRYLQLLTTIPHGNSGFAFAVIKVTGSPPANDCKAVLQNGFAQMSLLLVENKPCLSVGDDTFGEAMNIALNPNVYNLVEWGWSKSGATVNVTTRLNSGAPVTGALDAAYLGSFARMGFATGESPNQSVAGFVISDLEVSRDGLTESERVRIQTELTNRVTFMNT